MSGHLGALVKTGSITTTRTFQLRAWFHLPGDSNFCFDSNVFSNLNKEIYKACCQNQRIACR